MVYVLITVYLAVIAWIGYEFHRAPLVENEEDVFDDKNNKA